jgi:hypothetical protein
MDGRNLSPGFCVVGLNPHPIGGDSPFARSGRGAFALSAVARSDHEQRGGQKCGD